jgi:tetratricopeptide (TPR) repeat protein
MVHCCAECGKEEGVTLKACLKACKACMLVKYCNAECQKNHWPKHKKDCKQRAAELRDEALFKDPIKEECPICFLPMPNELICCWSLPPATITSGVPIYKAVRRNLDLASKTTKNHYTCCGKTICEGCLYSFNESGNIGTCPFCKSEIAGKTNEEHIKELMKRVKAKDANATCHLANHYYFGIMGLQQDRDKAIDLWKQAAKLGSGKAHCCLGNEYSQMRDLKKAKLYYEPAAMAGIDQARYQCGYIESELGNVERALKHWKIGASSGEYNSMHFMIMYHKMWRKVSKDEIDSTLEAYNNSCAEMRSEARDAALTMFIDSLEEQNDCPVS